MPLDRSVPVSRQRHDGNRARFVCRYQTNMNVNVDGAERLGVGSHFDLARPAAALERGADK